MKYTPSIPAIRTLALLALFLGTIAFPGPATAQSDSTQTPAQRRMLRGIRDGDITAVRAELDAGLVPNFTDPKGYPPLAWAVLENQPQMIGELVRRGADLNWKNSQDYPLLHMAVLNDKKDALRPLVQAGFKIDTAGAKDGKGKTIGGTALTIAAFEGKLEMVKILAELGSDLNFVDALNGTPTSRAWEKKHEAVARYLEGLGATDNPADAKGNPLRLKGATAPKTTPKAPSNSQTASSSSRPRTSNGPNILGSNPPPPPGSEVEATPLRAARPIHEVTVGNVLGGPLSGLWSSFSSKHSDWRLDEKGHRNDMDSSVRMIGGSRIDALPSDWASEIYSIGQSEGHIPSNPEATFLVAPKGGTAAVAAEENKIRQAEADATTAAAQAEADEAAAADDKAQAEADAKAEADRTKAEADAAAAKAEADAAKAEAERTRAEAEAAARPTAPATTTPAATTPAATTPAETTPEASAPAATRPPMPSMPGA